MMDSMFDRIEEEEEEERIECEVCGSEYDQEWKAVECCEDDEGDDIPGTEDEDDDIEC